MSKEKAKTPEKQGTSPKKGISRRGMILLGGALFTSLVFMPTVLILIVGMLPTMMSFMTCRTRIPIQAVSVGAMNFAGCAPFIFDLWSADMQSIDKSLEIITNPMTVIIMYVAAGLGYMINWTLVGLVASFKYQVGQNRLQAIKARQQDLVQRWGEDVAEPMSKIELEKMIRITKSK